MLDLDGYTDLERIGHGGLGDVYRATRTSTGGTVAIKVLRDISDESVAWNRTRRELTALVSLGGHAHVVQVVELLEHAPGLVMEYAPGGSVAGLIDRRGGTLDIGEVVLIGRQTASALAAAHEQGIVHRDVKPQNLLIDGFGQIKLCDFGIASLARTEEFRTRTSAISMRYASPEDLDDDAEVGPPADVYSLGATLLHLAHGAPPTLKERLAPWVPPPTDDADLAALDAILADCLQPDPAERPTMQEVHDRLEHLEWNLGDRRRALAVPPSAEPAAPVTHDAPTPLETALDDEPIVEHLEQVEQVERADDPTLYRTGRVRREPARPTPARRGGRTTVIVGGIGIVAAAVVAVVLLTGDDATAPVPPTVPPTVPTTVPSTGAASESDGPVVVERPAGLAAIDGPDVTWPIGAIGECLVQVDGIDRLQSTDCGQPHDLQRFAVGTLDDPTLTAPTDAELELAVAGHCLAAAPDLGLDDLQIAQTNPSAATWQEGDRDYQCLLGVPGARLVGSALG